ncbi:hypothetical protein H6P81_015958 [Aristolochia fimbriata]|uniref:Uncharacterized protein n=1 Tax=Aristolochia fimbriata TaxID=158543 RepID=A0AAV7EBK6_ARIFI|nr:hypothetical protein H6P81_015958 [Aristolochia fimbriata]
MALCRRDPYPAVGATAQASMSRRRHGSPRKTSGASLGGAAVGADLGGSSKYSNENFEGRRGESLPTLETAQPEVGSSGWKSTARRVVSGAPPKALENPEDRHRPFRRISPRTTYPAYLGSSAGGSGVSPAVLASRCCPLDFSPFSFDISPVGSTPIPVIFGFRYHMAPQRRQAGLTIVASRPLTTRMGPYGVLLTGDLGKGSRQNGSVTSGKGLALRAGHEGPCPEPVGCRWTARAAPAARAGRRVPAGGRTGNGPFGGLPQASNS